MFMSGELYAQSYCGTMINSFSYAEFNAYVARIRACFAYGYEPHVELLPLTHEERLRGCPGQQQITLFRNWPFTPDELRRVESILPYGTSSECIVDLFVCPETTFLTNEMCFIAQLQSSHRGQVIVLPRAIRVVNTLYETRQRERVVCIQYTCVK
ncbi:hypothetical protein CI109_100192 [Kwoniella shandongensis]|uniref:Uncharacterized protein n=1 Tax=Kwoniella shandongensis TaxID=1734106 RepID=A0AAJ8LDC3_9TREE